jgi:hypothetical protein
VAEDGRKIPEAVFCVTSSLSTTHDPTYRPKQRVKVRRGGGGEKSVGEDVDVGRTVSGLKRWTRTRSRSGTRDLIDLKVAWAA